MPNGFDIFFPCNPVVRYDLWIFLPFEIHYFFALLHLNVFGIRLKFSFHPQCCIMQNFGNYKKCNNNKKSRSTDNKTDTIKQFDKVRRFIKKIEIIRKTKFWNLQTKYKKKIQKYNKYPNESSKKRNVNIFSTLQFPKTTHISSFIVFDFRISLQNFIMIIFFPRSPYLGKIIVKI